MLLKDPSDQKIVVKDPKTLAEEFNAFFIKKIQDLAENITRKE